MQILFTAQPPADAEITVELLTRERRAETALAVPEAEFSGAPNSLLLLHHERRLYVGLGEAAKVTGDRVRAACGAAAKHLQAKGRNRRRSCWASGRTSPGRPWKARCWVRVPLRHVPGPQGGRPAPDPAGEN